MKESPSVCETNTIFFDENQSIAKRNHFQVHMSDIFANINVSKLKQYRSVKRAEPLNGQVRRQAPPAVQLEE